MSRRTVLSETPKNLRRFPTTLNAKRIESGNVIIFSVRQGTGLFESVHVQVTGIMFQEDYAAALKFNVVIMIYFAHCRCGLNVNPEISYADSTPMGLPVCFRLALLLGNLFPSVSSSVDGLRSGSVPDSW